MEEVSEIAAEEEEVKWFECHLCKLKEVYTSQIKKPAFLQNITFSEGTYVVQDPFTPPEKKQFFVLGSDCCVCKNPVCQSSDCSIYYKQRYCQKCAAEKKKNLPEQLWSKIKS